MKTIVLALMLINPDGTTTQIPVEHFQFASMTDCVKSSTYMNKGRISSAQNYMCVEYDPSLNVAKAVPPQPAKRNS